MKNPIKIFVSTFLIALIIFPFGFTSGCRQDSKKLVQQDQRDSLQIQTIRFEASRLDSLGEYYELSVFNYDSALIYYRKALPLFFELRDSSSASYIFENIGYVWKGAASYDSSIIYHQRSLDLGRKIGDKEKQAASYNNIGEIYQLLNQYDLSNKYLDSSIEFLNRIDNKENLWRPITTMGLNYCYLGQYQKALNLHIKASDLLKEYSSPSSLLDVYINLGYDYFNLRQYEKALNYYKNALSIYRKLQKSEYYGIVQGLIALVLNEQQNYNQAFRYADSALTSAIKRGSKIDEGASYYKLGIITLNNGKKDDAIKYLNQAVLLFRQCNTKEREGMAYYRLMQTRKKFDPNLAIFYGKLAVNILQEMRKSIHSLDKDVQSEYLKSKEAVYRELISLLIEEGRLGESQQVIGMLKDDEYFDYLRGGTNSSSSLNTRVDYTKKEAQWERRYSEIADSIILFSKGYETLFKKENRTELEQRQLQALTNDLKIARRGYEKAVSDLEKEFAQLNEKIEKIAFIKNSELLFDVLAKYGPGSVAIYTFISKENYYVIFVAPPNVRIAKHNKINAGTLNQDISNYRDVLQNPTQDPVPLAQKLYKALIGPIEKELDVYKPKNIIWSLDGVLRYIPVSALHDGKGYLVEKYRNIIFIPRNVSWINEVKKTGWKALGMGVSRSIGEFDSLPSVQDELYGIIQRNESGRKLGVFTGTIKLDNEFTQISMMDELRKNYPIVHIASHFQLNPGDNSSSFLLLGDGKKFTMDEFKYELQIFSKVMLLTLSACNTGVGSKSSGKEIEDFASLAQEQGAKAVLATLWAVPDKSTSELMKIFYRLREENKAKTFGESLQKAQLALLKGEIQGPTFASNRGMRKITEPVKKQSSFKQFKNNFKAPYSHPYYWAPFVMIGDIQ